MTSCRFCGHPLKHTLVDLGLSPLANAYVRTDQADLPDRFYPLHTMVCEQCKLMQVLDYEKPEVIFSDYLYFSSFSDQWLKQCCHYAETMIERFGLSSESLVIEVASNDGYLLQFFKEKGIRVLGVEPSDKVAEVAISKGVPTRFARPLTVRVPPDACVIKVFRLTTWLQTMLWPTCRISMIL